MDDIQLEPPQVAGAAPPKPSPLSRFGADAVVWLHRQAERLDLVPQEFGDSEPVDFGDGRSLTREWIRQAKLWASYSPEQVLALKTGAVVLGVALLALIVLVGAIR